MVTEQTTTCVHHWLCGRSQWPDPLDFESHVRTPAQCKKCGEQRIFSSPRLDGPVFDAESILNVERYLERVLVGER